MLVAAAGPISNLLQACVWALLFRLSGGDAVMPFDSLTHVTLYLGAEVNLLLAFFNLIPVPPLDGGNVLLGLLPPRLALVYSGIRQWGFIVLYAMMFTGVATSLIMPPTNFFMRMLLT
jgi:Zn-dependent protease